MSNGDSENDPDPVKSAPLKDYVKQFSDLRASSDAIDELEAELLFIARILWQEASARAQDENYKTVQLDHLEDAYDDLFEPHNLLQSATDDINQLSEQLEEVKNRSPIYKEWDSNEE